MLKALMRQDARHLQIANLSLLIILGGSVWTLDLEPTVLLALVSGSMLAQSVGLWLVRAGRWDYRSALITALSLFLLLRVEAPWQAFLIALIAMGSKFLLRLNGKHLFNPSMFGLIIALATGLGWVSTGQWGSGFLLLMVLLLGGPMTLLRVGRWDVSLTFILAYGLLLFSYGAWLGDPSTIAMHQLTSGALLLFATFMISDPMTIPDQRLGRVLFALLVVVVAGWIRLVLYIPNDALWALFLVSLMTPLLDRVWRAERFAW
uniref:Na+-transporting NADH:ubiquinone oxidoreductase, subunit NqrB n=1 Tax=Magnetococcus massalia (strain MO-1) TaxID=451514 RepID=A0A1S7LFE6_MAGMO|nr:Conserved membrane protein of unknown function [Candidatus Magnetococcus massalia]